MNPMSSPDSEIRLQRALEKLVTSLSGVKAAVITTPDGFEKARVAVSPRDASRLAALASSISAIGNMAVQEATTCEKYKCITIESGEGYIFIAEIPGPLVMIIITSAETILARLLYQARVFSP